MRKPEPTFEGMPFNPSPSEFDVPFVCSHCGDAILIHQPGDPEHTGLEAARDSQWSHLSDGTPLCYELIRWEMA